MDKDNIMEALGIQDWEDLSILGEKPEDDDVWGDWLGTTLSFVRDLDANGSDNHPDHRGGNTSIYFTDVIPEDEADDIGLYDDYPAHMFSASNVEEYLAGEWLIDRDFDDFQESTLQERVELFRKEVEEKGLITVLKNMKTVLLPCKLCGSRYNHKLVPMELEEIMAADIVLSSWSEGTKEEVLADIPLWEDHLNGNIWKCRLTRAYNVYMDDCTYWSGSLTDAIDYFKEDLPPAYRVLLERGEYTIDIM